MEKHLSIWFFKTLFVIEPLSGDDGWFREETSPVFFSTLDDGAAVLGHKIRQAKKYCRDFEALGIEFPEDVFSLGDKLFMELLNEVTNQTGLTLTQLRRIDQKMLLHYGDDEIILRFYTRSRARFMHSLINKDITDEPRLPESCSDLELGQMIFDWVASSK